MSGRNMRNLVQIFLCIFIIEYSFGQNNTIQIKRTFLKSYYSYTDLTQYTFNKNGDIVENTAVYMRDNKPDTVSQIKYKYKNDKLLEREVYQNKSLILNEKYSYKKGLLNKIQYLNDSETTNFYYDSNNNLTSDIMTKGLDTLRKITYKYKENELVELFRYSNAVDNEKITYKKSNDSIIETIYKHDSLFMEKPEIVVIKKIFNSKNIVSHFEKNLNNKTTLQKKFIYNTNNQISKISIVTFEYDLFYNERYIFTYENNLLNKIERQEDEYDGNWETKDLISFQIEKSNKKIKDKTIEKINSYLLNQILN